MLRPRDLIAAAVALGIVAPPVASIAGLGELGGFRMFTRLERAQVTVTAQDEAGVVREVPMTALVAHFGRDARRVLVPASEGVASEVATGSLVAAAPSLARVACSESAGARRVSVTVSRRTLEGAPIESIVHTRPCLR